MARLRTTKRAARSESPLAAACSTAVARCPWVLNQSAARLRTSTLSTSTLAAGRSRKSFFREYRPHQRVHPVVAEPPPYGLHERVAKRHLPEKQICIRAPSDLADQAGGDLVEQADRHQEVPVGAR